MKLEIGLGIPFNLWMNLQNGYNYDRLAIEARTAREREAIAYEAKCAELLNLKIIYKCLNVVSKLVEERVSALNAAFGDKLDVQKFKIQFAGCYKHSDKLQIDERNMNTWLALNWIKIANAQASVEYHQGDAVLAAT